jgi:hypothetical protein
MRPAWHVLARLSCAELPTQAPWALGLARPVVNPSTSFLVSGHCAELTPISTFTVRSTNGQLVLKRGLLTSITRLRGIIGSLHVTNR